MAEFTGKKCTLSHSTHASTSEEAVGGSGSGSTKGKNVEGAQIGKSYSKGSNPGDSKGSTSVSKVNVTGAKIKGKG